MGYTLKLKTTDADFVDPRAKITLVGPDGADAPLYQRDVPLSERAVTYALIEAQRWMVANVYNQPCHSLAEAKARELDTSSVDQFLSLNFPQSDVTLTVAKLRLAEAAEKMGYKLTEGVELEKI